MAQKAPATNPTSASRRPTRALRITGLEKACGVLQARMRALLPARIYSPTRVSELGAAIREQAHQVEALLERRGAVPADLTRPARLAYRWLGHLSDPACFERHLETLALLSERASQAAAGKRMPPVETALYNSAALYRARQLTDHIELVVHEGFCEAPVEVIDALVQMVFGRRSLARRKLIREFAASQAFTRLAHSLSAGPEPEGSPQGQVYNLEEVFQRVNAVYFQGSLERPRIAWSRRLTTRKMGHYQDASDTVMVSRTLDNPSVPPAVVDFIMYHELLHKKLGFRRIGKRRYAHTPEFRRAEKEFPQYAQAQAFLQAIAQQRPTTRRDRRPPSRRY